MAGKCLYMGECNLVWNRLGFVGISCILIEKEEEQQEQQEELLYVV